jgi:hypothetical protein
MRTRNTVRAAALAAAGILLSFTACEHVRETRTETRTIEASGASSAKVSLRMGAGELRLSGGAAALMEGEFTTNVDRWMPEIEYGVAGGHGDLKIRQPKGRSLFFGPRRNSWNVRLSGAVPVDLSVRLGAGESRLDMRGVDVGSIDVDMGVGELRLDLSGPRPRDLRVRIDGGVGSAVITLPRDIGVQVEVDGGIGSVSAHGLRKEGRRYVNDAFGRTAASLRVEIDAGIGSIDLRED